MPIGIKRSPLIECESPSADSGMNRFISAMPSSICWPFGENSHVEGRGNALVLERVGHAASRANRPRRLTQAPRLVETVTSGEVVTMRAASSSFARADLVQQRAEAGLGRHRRLGGNRQRVREWRAAAPASAACAVRTARSSRKPGSVRCRQGQALELIPFMARRALFSARCGRFPSAPASAGRRGCPCARRSAGQSP